MTTRKAGRPKGTRTETPFDKAFWVKVEQLRSYLSLSCLDMAEVLGVSRLTYYNWTTGRCNCSADATPRVADRIKKLTRLATQRKWPQPDTLHMTPKQRRDRLVALVQA